MDTEHGTKRAMADAPVSETTVLLKRRKTNKDLFGYKRHVLDREMLKLTKIHLRALEYVSPEESAVKIHGKTVEIPRKQIAFSPVPGLQYAFSGTKATARLEPDWMRRVREVVEREIGQPFNFILVNYYENGTKYIGPHHDSTKGLVPDSSIGSLSFGATRMFQFREGFDGTEVHKLMLAENDLLEIPWKTNVCYTHSLPRSTRIVHPRWNLTFRLFSVSSEPSSAPSDTAVSSTESRAPDPSS